MIPEEDGITHINIYSKGQTQLGRMLSNFYPCYVETDHGIFNSVEGYWYWLGCRDDYLRELSGYEAKKFGSEQPIKNKLPEDQFQEHIKRAITKKIIHNNRIRKPFVLSILPFKHYYVYGDKVVDAGYKWIVKHISDLRDKMIFEPKN